MHKWRALCSLTHYCQIPAEASGNWGSCTASFLWLFSKTAKKSARLPRWDQKTELDSCHVWEHPTCLGQPHADRLFLEPVVAIEAQLLEDITHLVRVTKRRGMEGGWTDSDGTRRYRREDRGNRARWRTGQAYKKKTDRQVSWIPTETTGTDTCRNSAGLTPAYPRGWSALTWACAAAMHAASWQGCRANVANTCPKHARCKTWRRIHAGSALKLNPTICHRLMLHCKVNAGNQTPSISRTVVFFCPTSHPLLDAYWKPLCCIFLNELGRLRSLING